FARSVVHKAAGAVFVHRGQAVGGSKVNTDDGHVVRSLPRVSLCSFGSFQADVLRVFQEQLPLQTGSLVALAVAVGLVALADDGDHVAVLGVVKGVVQGVQAVGNFHTGHVGAALGDADFNIRQDGLHFLKAVVVFGEDEEIRQAAGHLA